MRGVRSRAIAVACLGTQLVACTAEAQSGSASVARREVGVEFSGGTAWSLPTPLTVRLPGEPAVRLRARYSTRPFADAPYYAYRVSVGSRDRAIEAELVHHKLYLENPVQPIERFEVTHGYNLVTANARAPLGSFAVRLGLGVVVAHAEGRVAGEPVGQTRTLLGGGYHVAGPTLQLGLARRHVFGRRKLAALATPELKVTASSARVPVGRGHVHVPNVAVHALFGLGLRRAW